MVPFTSSRVFAVSLFILSYVTENKSTSYKKIAYLKHVENGIFNRLLFSIANVNEEKLKALQKNLWTKLDQPNETSGTLKHANESKEDTLAALLKDYNAQAIDGLLDEDDLNVTPRKAEDIFNLMNENDGYDFDDSEEAKKYKLRSIIENLNNVAMKKYVGISKEDIVMPNEASLTIPTVNSRNNESEFVLNKYAIQNDVEEIDNGKNELQISQPDGKIKTKVALRIWKGLSKKAKKKCRKACESAYKSICRDYKCSKYMKKDFKKLCKSHCSHRFDNDD